MRDSTLGRSVAFFSLLVVAGCKSTGSSSGQAADPEGVNYQVTLTSTWTPQNHPLEYPPSGLVTGPHFSGLIGASHGESYDLYQEGQLPTAGLERLSEEGRHDPLDREIQSAIAEGKAGMLFETGALRDFSQSAVTTVKVTSQFPMVSAVAMIAPSPDWFTGAKDVSLKQEGAWVKNMTVTLYAWDSGGDDGTTYLAPDQDNNPKKATQPARTAHFVKDGNPVTVGTLTFTRQ